MALGANHKGSNSVRWVQIGFSKESKYVYLPGEYLWCAICVTPSCVKTPWAVGASQHQIWFRWLSRGLSWRTSSFSGLLDDAELLLVLLLLLPLLLLLRLVLVVIVLGLNSAFCCSTREKMIINGALILSMINYLGPVGEKRTHKSGFSRTNGPESSVRELVPSSLLFSILSVSSSSRTTFDHLYFILQASLFYYRMLPVDDTCTCYQHSSEKHEGASGFIYFATIVYCLLMVRLLRLLVEGGKNFGWSRGICFRRKKR